MENRNMDKDGPNKEEQAEENSCLSKGSIKELEPQHLLRLGNPPFTGNCTQKLFFHSSLGLQNKLLKHIITLDERYFLRCLELVHIHSTCNFSSNMQILSKSSGSTEVRNENICTNNGNLAIECPQAAGTESYVPDSSEEWILGAITGSKSMLNILKSPLLNQLGSVNKENIHDSEEATVFSDFMSSPGGPEYQAYGSEHVHRRVLSVSSTTTSTCSDQSCLSAAAPISQGMLQRRWKNGLPHYVFSVDGKKDVYTADLLKIDSPDDKFLDYVYTFHSRPEGKKERALGESHLVGKMTVSTSVTLSSTKLEIMETRFVVFGSMDQYMNEIQASHILRKNNKRLAKKVTDVFRTSQSYKQRSLSQFGGTSAILEDASWTPSIDMYDDYHSCGNAFLDQQIPPNFELAAIVMRDPIFDNSKEKETGGWGMKFLKKSPTETKNAPPGSRGNSECSTSMDVIVPTGFHGGPRSIHAGPSSLLERWNSGGHCDCGGWDVGCPLTVLKTGNEASSQTTSGECQTFDLYIQGSKQCAPVMKMSNIHDGLYYIHFHSTLSALQAFAIAAAFIHRHSPFLRPKLYRK
ncbi:uncharacterized protein LOC132038300 [Lycium ferocissimum]|uniref:uncharacterized protein LOC132038300 n=1 Tax=Lycium ferocissimum TaxID=112874 RepID=UPI0028167633|nr:uncharacterized protein LOC132038300 [Lycium ferocissimum]XP_059285042.1 uncharacterized protein LOC132038300 [Lycium ferocissimum]XP_059285080.1 uncharacterized protein LOC132038300 [Lycium ferocissimum]